jgi:hypothetical protein
MIWRDRRGRSRRVRKLVCLARILIEELDPALDAEVEQLWIAEAQLRYEAFLNGELEALRGDDVMARARIRSQRQRREM